MKPGRRVRSRRVNCSLDNRSKAVSTIGACAGCCCGGGGAAGGGVSGGGGGGPAHSMADGVTNALEYSVLRRERGLAGEEPVQEHAIGCGE